MKLKVGKHKFLILIILLVVLITGATFTYAYFSSNIEGNEEAKEQVVTTARLEILYSDGTLISQMDAYPGDSASKTFTVKNTGTKEVEYDILWKDVVNNFVDKGDLFYTLTCSTDNESGECKEQSFQKQMANTTNTENIIKKIHILPGETHTYDLDLNFVFKEDNQNDNQGKSITANVQIVEFTDPVITMNVENGIVDQASKTTPFGEDVEFTVTPNTGYLMSNITIDCDNDATYSVDGNTVIISNTILNNTCDVNFIPSFDMNGYVVNQNNEPMSGVNVEIHSEVKSAITDSTGYFTLSNVQAGEHLLYVKRNQTQIHSSSLKLNKGGSFNIDNNLSIITATDTTKPVKVKIIINNEEQKTIEQDPNYRVIINPTNAEVNEPIKIAGSGSKVEELVTPQTGHEFNNVVCTNNQTGSYENNKIVIDSLTDDTECAISFGASSYLASFNAQSGTQSFNEKTVTYGESYGELPEITPNDGYTFKGWYTQSTGGTKIESDTVVSMTSNHNLYAQYNTLNYTVNYNCTENGGSCSITNSKVNYGDNVDLSKTATKTDFEFVGWNTDKDATSGLSTLRMSANDITLYAIYKKTIRVTYNENNSTLSKISDVCEIYNKTTSCTFISPIITRQNWTIVGFNESIDGTTSQLNSNTSYNVDSNKIYYAITKDETAPVVSSVTGSTSLENLTLTSTITATDANSNIAKYYHGYILNNGTNTCSNVTYTESTNASLTFNNIGVGNYLVCGYAKDPTENQSNIASITTSLSVPTENFVYTGNYQEYTVPVTGYYKIETWGASGDNSTISGYGAYVSGNIYLEKKEKIFIYAGGNGNSGFNVGNITNNHPTSGNGYSGGGATDVRLTPGDWDNNSSLISRIMVASGGGGGGDYFCSPNYGGVGGTLIGEKGTKCCGVDGEIATGGTPIAGGISGSGSISEGTIGRNGSFGIGGIQTGLVGAGGGGYYGGGSGPHGTGTVGGGGGGSSYASGYAGVNSVDNNTTITHNNNTIHYSGKYFIDLKMEAGINSGNGKAKITYFGSESKRRNETFNNIRYIKDCINGSNANLENHWVEIQAIKNGKNIAKGKLGKLYNSDNSEVLTPSSSNTLYSFATDGLITNINGSTGYATGTIYTGNQCFIIDLADEEGLTHNIDEIAIWHYWGDNRTYINNITSVSTDGVSYTPVIKKTSAETSDGKRVTAFEIGTKYTATNLVLNGGFESGLTNWLKFWENDRSNIDLTLNKTKSGMYAIRNLNGAIYTAGIQHIHDIPQIVSNVNHQYYYSSWNYTANNGGAICYIDINFTTDEGSNWGGLSQYTVGKWEKISYIYTTPYNNTIDIDVAPAVTQSSTATADCYTDEVVLIDLTDTFGAGNEPDKAWCDEHIDFFEGTTFIYK